MSDDYTERITPGAFSRSVSRPIPVVWPDQQRIGTSVLKDDGTVSVEITDPKWAARLGFTAATYVFPYGFTPEQPPTQEDM